MACLYNVPYLLRRQLWALIVLMDFDYSRLKVADYKIEPTYLTLWLEDRLDMISSCASCLTLEIPIENMAILISPDHCMIEKCIHNISVQTLNEACQWFDNLKTGEQRNSIMHDY